MKFSLGFLTIFTVFFLIWYLYFPSQETIVSFCDVGQGDAILISHGFSQVLVDTGRDSRVLSCLNSNMPFWDREIDFVVVTHADSDHYGGLDEVLETFSVKTLMMNNTFKQNDDLLALSSLIREKLDEGMELVSSSDVNYFSFSDCCKVSVLHPFGKQFPFVFEKGESTENILSDVEIKSEEKTDDENSRSIVLLLEVSRVSFMLTGDLEAEGEKSLIKRHLINDLDVLKIAHHGSKTGTTSDFLRFSKPELGIIGVGEGNTYGHPDQSVLRRLEEFGVSVLRTDLSGTITVVTDGQKYWIR